MQVSLWCARRLIQGAASLGLAALLVVTQMIAIASAVNIETVPVGNPGNVGEQSGGGLPDDPSSLGPPAIVGSVGYEYRIGRYEVTNEQYAEFLNFKAGSDPLGLFNLQMSSNPVGGITRSGDSGSYTYAAKPNMGNKPVVFVSWYDAVRFANWLHNGQGAGDTETGAYTLLGGTPIPSNGLLVVRNPGAQWFLTSEDEWYKAAFYDPTLADGAGDYWRYATRSDTAPAIAAVNSVGDLIPGANVANYDFGADWNGINGNVTTVGSAGPLSESYYDTSDQNGNVWEWTEALLGGSSQTRFLRQGSWNYPERELAATNRDFRLPPEGEWPEVGFRVATIVPEPSTKLLGLLALAGLLACGRYMRRHRQVV